MFLIKKRNRELLPIPEALDCLPLRAKSSRYHREHFCFHRNGLKLSRFQEYYEKQKRFILCYYRCLSIYFYCCFYWFSRCKITQYFLNSEKIVFKTNKKALNNRQLYIIFTIIFRNNEPILLIINQLEHTLTFVKNFPLFLFFRIIILCNFAITNVGRL